MAQIARCAAMLTDEQGWSRANERCNSVANLLVHLRGNVSQWILSGIGGLLIDRDRPAEFAARGPAPLAPAVAELAETVAAATRLIRGIAPDDWAAPRSIQGYSVTTMSAVFHVVEHFSFHTGQIVHMTKAIRNVDLSLFDAQGRPLTPRGDKPW